MKNNRGIPENVAKDYMSYLLTLDLCMESCGFNRVHFLPHSLYLLMAEGVKIQSRYKDIFSFDLSCVDERRWTGV